MTLQANTLSMFRCCLYNDIEFVGSTMATMRPRLQPFSLVDLLYRAASIKTQMEWIFAPSSNLTFTQLLNHLLRNRGIPLRPLL